MTKCRRWFDRYQKQAGLTVYVGPTASVDSGTWKDFREDYRTAMSGGTGISGTGISSPGMYRTVEDPNWRPHGSSSHRDYGDRDYGDRDYGDRDYGGRDYGGRDYGSGGRGCPNGSGRRDHPSGSAGRDSGSGGRAYAGAYAGGNGISTVARGSPPGDFSFRQFSDQMGGMDECSPVVVGDYEKQLVRRIVQPRGGRAMPTMGELDGFRREASAVDLVSILEAISEYILNETQSWQWKIRALALLQTLLVRDRL
ncbi:hypothetical protein GNI_149790 [Gregarina niphandrodes]|uniref:Uncharacterized protein n=1 Tax=Gregarina niphandrodes TaxID=110365 RepID=A0A023AZN1_GRENI|nr:hypothetical protein GNI_149790 [Gregarina niphandrodes]EZG44248.1 hypothetical protein GNI_149790 [Gregarina niphandrodes]|eukprot:XP_011132741.1 hypothetical protein GNI_149790 [Gregarina niphandrodes]